MADKLLLKLGIRVSPRTVRKYLDDSRPHGGAGNLHWSTFVRNHGKAVVACDFLISVTVSFCVLYVFVAMEIDSGGFSMPTSPSIQPRKWTIQQFREFLAFDHPYRLVIQDRDAIFSTGVDTALRDFAIRTLRTPV